MSEVASAYVSLIPSARGFGSKMDSQIGPQINASGKKAGAGFGKLFAVGAALAIGKKAFDFLGDSIGEAREAQKVGALTESIIKSTGKAAGITADQVGAMAGRLSAVTGIDDEVIQQGSNLLLTFKNVKNYVDGEFVGVFDRATASAVDLSAAGFGSVDGAAKMLGKALNDPLKGISALGRAGVTFTAAQQEQIKALVESGEAAKAQGLILAEVESQVGGAAAASATFGEKASVAFGNIKEQIGTALLPMVDRLLQAFLGMVPTITKIIAGIGPAFSSISKAVMPIVAVVRDALQPVLDRVGSWVEQNPAFVKAFALALGGLVIAIGAVTFATAAFSVALNSTGIPLLIIGVAALIAGLVIAYQRSDQFRAIVDGVGAAVKNFAAFLQASVLPVLQRTAAVVGTKLKPVLDQLVTTFQGKVLPAVQRAVVKFREWQPAIQRATLAVAKIAGKMVEFYAVVLSKVLPVLIRFAGFMISNYVTAIVGAITVLGQIITKVVAFGQALADGVKSAGEFLTGVKTKVTKVLTLIEGIPDKITAAFANAGTLLYDAGASIIGGLIDGISSKAGALKDKLGEYTSMIPKLKGPPKKDATLLTPAGKLIIDGLIAGLDYGKPKLEKALKGLTEKIRSSLDGLKSTLSGFKSDFDSLASSVASAFNPDMFGAVGKVADELSPATTALQEFMAGLSGNNGNLTAMLAALDQLKAAGASKAFLSGLFQSGNTELAGQLSTAGPAAVKQASDLFDQNAALAATLGSNVAQNQFGEQIDKTTAAINELRKELKGAPKETGKETAKYLADAKFEVVGGNPGQVAYLRTGRRN